MTATLTVDGIKRLRREVEELDKEMDKHLHKQPYKPRRMGAVERVIHRLDHLGKRGA